jgi:hypothetical protein
MMPRLPAAFRLPALAFGSSSARCAMGSPYGRLTRHGLDRNGVATFDTYELRPGRVLPLPRDGGVLPTGQNPPVGACRFPAASPAPRSSRLSGPYVTRRTAVH